MKKMKWFDVKEYLPEPNIPVLVSDGYGEVAVVKLDDNKRWYSNNKDENILEAFHDEGVISIEVNPDYIRFWTLIDSESCPLPDWKD